MRKILSKLGLASIKVSSPHVNFYRRIIAAMRKGDSLPVTAESAMQALEFCMGVYESGINGERVELPLSTSSHVFTGVTPDLYSARKSKALIAIKPLAREEDLRIGLIGLDTSHAPTFASLINNPLTPNYLSGARVVAGYAGGSPDMEISASRVDGFTHELEYRYGIPMYNDPARVAEVSDLVFIIASDGRQHVDLLEKVASAGKPVFVDKPFAISTKDAEKMFEIAAKHDLKLTACSAFRYADGLVQDLAKIRNSSEVIKECEVQIWMPIQETQGRYFWYGIHASEMLVAVMGTGARQVKSRQEGDQDFIDVEYGDGRRGKIIGSQSDSRYLVKIVTDKKTHHIDLAASVPTLAPRLLWAVIDSLTEGKAPRLWRAGDSGAIPGDRPSRFLDPTSEDTREVISILDMAQKSMVNGEAVCSG
jgi:predicted dehydrogenase